MTRSRRPPRLVLTVLSIYLPALIFSIGEGAIMPVVAVIATGLGASLAVSGAVAGAVMVGQVAGDIPSGVLVSRFGERPAMLMSSSVSFVAVVFCLLARSWALLAVGVFVLGMSGATFALARHTYLTTSVPLRYRARSLSLLGGVSRLGMFVGPAIASFVIARHGPQSVFSVHIVACVLVTAVLLILPQPPQYAEPVPEADFPAPAPASVDPQATSVRAHRPMLVRLGSAVSLLAAVRASKLVMVPLWALHIGLSATQITMVVTISAAAELVLFYASGQVMDRFGRLASVVPCLGGLAIGHALLPLAHSFDTLLVAGVVLGLTNGIGSGIQLTLGADVAPKAAPAKVLGAWRLFGDAGGAIAPLVVSALIALASLQAATWTIVAVGMVGVALMIRYVPRFAQPVTVSAR